MNCTFKFGEGENGEDDVGEMHVIQEYPGGVKRDICIQGGNMSKGRAKRGVYCQANGCHLC